ncbi:hypothetical protein FOA52_011814 [Chlamydomonas sp. UWO 241]|nr:hypothetical protein FOA52_011814 [Chlamydomonas sp. UWO 241]
MAHQSRMGAAPHVCAQLAHAGCHRHPLLAVDHQGRAGRLHIPLSAASSAGQAAQGTPPAPAAKTPLQQTILNGILSISNVPYSSYVPAPVTFLHKVDARIKQLWLVAIFFTIARASPAVRVGIAGVVAAASIAVLPPRLWRSQLLRLSALCALLMVSTALFSDGIPPVLQERDPLPADLGLPPLQPTGYSYVVLHAWFITVTQRSVNLALTAGALTFCALQTSSLCLVTTPGEEMAMGMRWWLAPLRLLRVNTQEIAITLLLSLRFMSLVFEEVRNLSLGLASRGVDWVAQGTGGSLQLAGRLCLRLFGNLFHRSESIAQAMVARGFVGPERHNFYMMKINRTSYLANVLALASLAAFIASAAYYKF